MAGNRIPSLVELPISFAVYGLLYVHESLVLFVALLVVRPLSIALHFQVHIFAL